MTEALPTRALLEKLCKWRSLFAGWQLGTRPDTDPECQAVRDHRELSILLRVEVTALTRLMLDAGVFTQEQLGAAIGSEARNLDRDYQRRFPGVTATEHGLSFDASRLAEIQSWMGGWKP
jgi:hypothetical protein